MISVLLHAYMPDERDRLLDALGAPDSRLAGAEFAGTRRRSRGRAARAAVPQAGLMPAR